MIPAGGPVICTALCGTAVRCGTCSTCPRRPARCATDPTATTTSKSAAEEPHTAGQSSRWLVAASTCSGRCCGRTEPGAQHHHRKYLRQLDKTIEIPSARPLTRRQAGRADHGWSAPAAESVDADAAGTGGLNDGPGRCAAVSVDAAPAATVSETANSVDRQPDRCSRDTTASIDHREAQTQLTADLLRAPPLAEQFGDTPMR